MAREESYKDFFRFLSFCLRFSKLELKYGSFLLPVTQSIYKIMVWLNQVKNL